MKGIRARAQVARGITDPIMARAVQQLEDHAQETTKHEHGPFARLSDGFAPAPRTSDFGRTLHEDGVWRYNPVRNSNAAAVVANAADTYLTGSSLAVPANVTLRPGVVLRWRLAASKTAAGVAVPTWTVRFGPLGTVTDTALVTLTGRTAQTAVASLSFVEIVALLRASGSAAADLQTALVLTQSTAATGFATVSSYSFVAGSGAFASTPLGYRFGLSVNPGAAGVWTHEMVQSEMVLT